MKLFWKINIYISILTFILFCVYVVSISELFFASVAKYNIPVTGWFFIYGAFLEVIQMPLCLAALFLRNKPKYVWLFFLMMIVFFTIKMSVYVYIFLG